MLQLQRGQRPLVGVSFDSPGSTRSCLELLKVVHIVLTVVLLTYLLQ
jgi:hypothetical protein